MQNFVNYLIEQQNKFFKKRTETKAKNISFGATLCLNSKLEEKKQKLDKEIKILLKKFSNNQNELIKYIELNGTRVYRYKNAKKIFGLISQEIGFIPETKGLKALLINLMIDYKLDFHRESIFVLDKQKSDNFWLIQQFYKWYAMKNGMSGYDAKSQEAFNGFLYNNSDNKLKTLCVDEILDIKEAIARDIESINFVLEYAKTSVDSKKASVKINNGGALV